MSSLSSYVPPLNKVTNFFWFGSLIGYFGISTGSTLGTAGRVHLTAVPIFYDGITSRATIRVLTAGGAGTKLRIVGYKDNGNTPAGGALLFDSGDIAADSTGVKVVIFSAPITVKAGYIWIGIETQDAVVAFNRYAGNPTWGDLAGEVLVGCQFDNPGGYGAVPAICPAVAGASAVDPVCAVRVDRWLGPK